MNWINWWMRIVFAEMEWVPQHAKNEIQREKRIKKKLQQNLNACQRNERIPIHLQNQSKYVYNIGMDTHFNLHISNEYVYIFYYFLLLHSSLHLDRFFFLFCVCSAIDGHAVIQLSISAIVVDVDVMIVSSSTLSSSSCLVLLLFFEIHFVNLEHNKSNCFAMLVFFPFFLLDSSFQFHSRLHTQIITKQIFRYGRG